MDIATHLTQDLDAEGRQLRVTEFRDYTGEVIRSIFLDMAEFRHNWSNPDRRSEVSQLLREKGIDVDHAGEIFDNPEADPFDLLCNIAWNAPVMTRAQRVKRVREQQVAFFEEHGEEARKILTALLTKYADHGPSEFSMPDVLKVSPISELGNVSEIIKMFGGAKNFRKSVTRLQQLLYVA